MIIILFEEQAHPSDIEKACAIFTEQNIPSYLVSPQMLVGEAHANSTILPRLKELPRVHCVQERNQPYFLISREFQAADTQIPLGETFFTPQSFTLIAGPCSIEHPRMLNETAHFLSGLGIKILRAGTYKCRTSPYSFQGNGEKALEHLKSSATKFSMKTVTEVVGEDVTEKTAEYTDILQVGSRNSQNFQLLQKVGKQTKPVLLKRGFMNTVQEFLLSAEYVALAGNRQIILCERGIRTFETATRNTLDIASVPLVRQVSHLPMIVDPSHAAGRRDIVIPLVKAALAAGAQGAIIEVHPNPKHALSDGAQSLDFHEFERLVSEVRTLAQAMNIQVV